MIGLLVGNIYDEFSMKLFKNQIRFTDVSKSERVGLWRHRWTTASHAASAGHFSEQFSLRFWSVGLVAASSEEQLGRTSSSIIVVVSCSVWEIWVTPSTREEAECVVCSPWRKIGIKPRCECLSWKENLHFWMIFPDFILANLVS